MKSGSLVYLSLLVALAPTALLAQRTPQRCVGRENPLSHAVVRPEGEPGDRLTLTGTVRDSDGQPVAGARVQIFHTDAEGYYSERSMEEDNPRLCGVISTGPDGSYRFETTNPARYATGGGGPPHVHYTVWVAERPPEHFLLQLPAPAPTGHQPVERAAEGDRSARVRPLIRSSENQLHAVRDLVFD